MYEEIDNMGVVCKSRELTELKKDIGQPQKISS
jgi:hypothetical protein